ncbi:MAG: single-stranded-DNA-specific exonuclease RecJ [Caldilineaceae bacterium]|nr:single-stranded-DNA-specific exonuclease RecJ [Caldilineaceae bacterium]
MSDEQTPPTRQGKHWKLYPPAPDKFLRSIPEHPLLLQVLYNRGMRSETGVADFLVSEDAVLENPYQLADMRPAVERILQAIERQETICVYGDFDADGVCATALLVNALQAAGGRVGPYIPDRVDEGYGLNLDALSAIAEKAHLLITVDCGIRSVTEVAYAQQLGMDIIITDHHSIGPTLPPALAVINPQREDVPNPATRLAGVGVAYRLAQAVLRAAVDLPNATIDGDRAAELEQELLDLVALGTVADMMPLLGDNRSLVRRGLAQLNATQRPGLEALLLQSDLRPGSVDTTAISFRLGPRINAAGRLAHAKVAYRLLRTTDVTEAYTLATELESLNNQRKALTDQAQAAAEEQLNGNANAPMIFVHSPEIVAGIVGLVAGKLADRFYRPAIVVEEGPLESRGSARSIAEFDISAALDSVSGYLVRHGGHSRAAGFTVKSENLPALQAELTALAGATLGERDDLRPTLWIDAETTLEQLTWGALGQLARLEPTGYDNPTPHLLCRNLRVRDLRTVGGGKHLKMIVDQDAQSSVLDAVAFRQGEWANELQVGDRVDLVFQLEANEWQGRQSLQLNVQDMRRAGSGATIEVGTPPHVDP